MATGNLNESEAFYAFLGQRLATGSCNESPEELLRAWRKTAEYTETVRAIKECIPDMEAGRGTALEQAATEIRDDLGFGDPT